LLFADKIKIKAKHKNTLVFCDLQPNIFRSEAGIIPAERAKSGFCFSLIK
jgi:hypothetical protein